MRLLVTSRTPLFTLALLALAACSRDDRSAAHNPQVAASAPVRRPNDQFVLRIKSTGGEARVFAYPRLDTVIWTADGAPAPAHVLSFDDEAGTIIYVDAKGAPGRIDFRQGTASTVTKTKLSAVASGDGANVYGVAADGFIERNGPSGPWRWKPRMPAKDIVPMPDGTLFVLAPRGDSTVVWRLRPPLEKIVDSVKVSRVSRTLRTVVGDRVYLGSGNELTGVRTKTMERTSSIHFDNEIENIAATPSGDRVFVVTKGSTSVDIVDRYRDAISGKIDLARHAAELRVDPFGRYLLARPDDADSVLVIALGTNRVIGSIASTWRDDLPFVGPDGGIVLAQGTDVVIADGETLRNTARVRGGAADFWYPFRWTGFRPRDARLDTPVDFGTDSTKGDSTAKPDSTGAAKPVPSPTPPPPVRDTTPKRGTGFTVSFAALMAPDKARELAASIHVGTETARVVTSVRDGATIYRVVLGPYPTREDAERVGKDAKLSFWVYEGGP
jgi:hypothetical protein